jgi:hypothetical protein
MRHSLWLFLAISCLGAAALCPPGEGAVTGTVAVWRVEDIRPGMKGHGLSVFKGTTIERFEVEIIGVLKNTSPGRDMVLARLSGCDLERTGVIAGMSGSPVYVQGKLVGAVAYAWAYGKDPIAGITPFSQMAEYAVQQINQPASPKFTQRQVLPGPIVVNGQSYGSVGIAADAGSAGKDGMWMVPLRTPLAATGFSARSLSLLQERLGGSEVFPVQTGGVARHVKDKEADAPLKPGSPLAVSLVTGDFDLSGIGTLTHIDGHRVYGWGHPFMSLGGCELPMMSGYIHTIYPRQTVSFKMGSPLKMIGTMDADTSTCIAGTLGRQADMMPITATVQRDPSSPPKTFRCEIVRQKLLLPQLVFAVLTNSVDMEGELPEELTAEMDLQIEIEGHAPILIRDVFSGSTYAGSRAPVALYSQVAAVLQTLLVNPYQEVRLKSITCETRFYGVRTYAEIDGVQLHNEVYAPGETLKATVYLQPYKGRREKVTVALPLPANMPEGSYTAFISDDAANLRATMRTNPSFLNPASLEQVIAGLRHISSARRNQLAVRVNLPQRGVTLETQTLPQLPESMAEMLTDSRRTKAQPIGRALVSHLPTDWCLQGTEMVRFTVSRNKHAGMEP